MKDKVFLSLTRCQVHAYYNVRTYSYIYDIPHQKPLDSDLSECPLGYSNHIGLDLVAWSL